MNKNFIETTPIYFETEMRTDYDVSVQNTTEVKVVALDFENRKGFRLGNYYVPKGRKELAKGSQAKIYDCYNDEDKQTYVAKVYSKKLPDIESIREINEKIMKISSENIAHIFAAGDTNDGEFYMVVMEKYQELPHGVIKFNKNKNPKEYLYEFAQIVKDLHSGLEDLHMENIFHSDIKPKNIMCKEDEHGKLRFVLIDFGACVETFGKLNEENVKSRAFTKAYLPPEVVQGKRYVNERTDNYALGVTLAELINGAYPMLKEGVWSLPGGVPEEIHELLMGLLYHNIENPEEVLPRWDDDDVEVWLEEIRDKRHMEAHKIVW